VPLRVLFADDDACILGGLADSLRRRPSGWEARFALGGEAAVDLISNQRFDVVVSDLSMPRVDGLTVLERARDAQPDAVRIVLSGGAGPRAALEVTRVAHRYIAKPYREEDLRTAIDRACDLRRLLREEGWRRAAGGVMALPSCPRLYTDLTDLMADPDATAAHAAALVERDVVTMAILGAIALALMLLAWKELKLLAFDPDFGTSLGFPMRVLDVLLTGMLVVAIVIGLQTVGVVLMAAMVIAPAAAARQWTNRLATMIVLSATFGALAGVVGALLSFTQEGLPTGPTIVLVLTVIVFFSLFFASARGLVWEWLRRRRQRRHLMLSGPLIDGGRSRP
jgi:CheY-like chemotaxis protein